MTCFVGLILLILDILYFFGNILAIIFLVLYPQQFEKYLYVIISHKNNIRVLILFLKNYLNKLLCF